MPAATPLPKRSSRRALVPREHGAYGQLALPLVSALALGRPTLASAALALAVVLVFVAHEPLLVSLGQRGTRTREFDGPRARRLFFGLAAAATFLAFFGIARAPGSARVSLLVPAGLALIVAGLVATRREKTAAGEVTVACTLASSSLAVALCGGVPPGRALAAVGVWIVSFVAATLAVRGLLKKARARGERPGRTARLLAVALLVLFAGAMLAALGLPKAADLALLPTPLLSAVVLVSDFSPKHLRTLGWAIVGAGLVTLLLLVATLR
ncbi:MAG TPA: YwiC-like family protein [Anaeromyxobacteraceae bacterium]|nr:YwiC-like family protein [Anaeromyxobacteraceae bacterium]